MVSTSTIALLTTTPARDNGSNQADDGDGHAEEHPETKDDPDDRQRHRKQNHKRVENTLKRRCHDDIHQEDGESKRKLHGGQ